MTKCIDQYEFVIQVIIFTFYFIKLSANAALICQMAFLQTDFDGALFDACETALSQP